MPIAHPPPLIVAHRGASALAPENTFAAFDLALELGADALETDLQVTADGFVVCLHDDTLQRTSTGRGAVDQRTWPEIASLDAGSWFDPRFANERIPRLEDLLARYATRTTLHLELKTPSAVERVIEAVTAADTSRLELSSFDASTLQALRARLPEIRLCLLVERWGGDSPGISAIGAPASDLTHERVAEAHNRHLAVRAWSIPTRAEAARLRAIGIDALTLDDPRW